MRANVYIDGFNLYYGALKGSRFKWLDLEAFSRILVPNHDINRIRYFTARITARPEDPGAPTRQDIYLRALAANPKVSIHFGRFQERRTRMALASPQLGMPRTVEVLRTDEKGTDVKIATYLLLDAFRHECDLSVVVSNDADLSEPIRVLMSEFGVPVGIVNPTPPSQRSMELASLRPVFHKQAQPRGLRRAQLPPVVFNGRQRLCRPPSW